MNPVIDLFTTTGRMITSDPPLQNLDHKIRLKRSWRTSLAEETEADVPGLEVLPWECCFRDTWLLFMGGGTEWCLGGSLLNGKWKMKRAASPIKGSIRFVVPLLLGVVCGFGFSCGFLLFALCPVL